MRKQLAIKGHEYRGDEVIGILETLGASNKNNYAGNYPSTLYILNDNDIYLGYACDDREVFTLEEFLEKFPFKNNDVVINDNYSGVGIITEMVWDSVNWCVKYCVKFEDFGIMVWLKCDEIKLSNINLTDNADQLHELCESKTSTLMIDSEACKDEVEIVLNDYEIKVRDGKTYAVKKKPKYPTTYEECCGVLGMTYDYPDIKMVSIAEYYLYSKFIRLIRCRDAYWKIADNWKPDWNDNYQKKWIINFYQDEINLTNGTNVHFVLAFPTKEMRDAFYKNFKDLIEDCKELL